MTCLLPQFKCQPDTFSISSILHPPSASSSAPSLLRNRDSVCFRTQCAVSTPPAPTAAAETAVFDVEKLRLSYVESNSNSLSAYAHANFSSTLGSPAEAKFDTALAAKVLIENEEAVIAAAAAEAVALARAAAKFAKDAAQMAIISPPKKPESKPEGQLKQNMASFLLPVTAITLLLFVLSPSPSSADLVLDTDGNPLQNGGQYYILPHSKNTGGLIVDGLVKPGQICPAYVGTAHSGEDGMPLEILSQYRVFHLSTSLPLQLTFKPLVPFCGFMPLRWWVAPSDANDQSRIIVGVEGPFKPTYAFFAEKSDAGENVYNIKFCHLLEFTYKSKFMSKSKKIKTSDDDDDDEGQDDDDYDDLKECKDVTILDDGRLGVAKDSPFPVTFKKKSTFPFLAANM